MDDYDKKVDNRDKLEKPWEIIKKKERIAI